jgi:acyl-CoA hydrolase
MLAMTGSGPVARADAAENNVAAANPRAIARPRTSSRYQMRNECAKTTEMTTELTTMTEIILPSDSNALGTAFGGKVMQWIDVCAAIAAQRYCRKTVVTASMDDLHFHAPIKVGMIATLEAGVWATFKRSLEVRVEVHSENPITAERRHCCSAMLTFVALDASGKATDVPQLPLDDEEARARHKEAEERRAQRLANRDRGRSRISAAGA